MNQQDYIELGLNGEGPLKLILRGSIEAVQENKVGVVSVVYATMDKSLAEKKINELISQKDGAYYMVYSVPMDIDLQALEHYPSIAIAKDDLI